MNEELIQLTTNIKDYLTELKKNLDQYDKEHKNNIEIQNNNLKTMQSDYIAILDKDFAAAWNSTRTLNKNEYEVFKEYFFKELGPLLLFPEINNYIYHKPLGYAGDFQMMNYIYDYGDKYLGKSSFEKLINFYTCQVPICKCNRIRKEYIKANILRSIKDNRNKKVVKITSIASGSAREIIELVTANKINSPVELTLYDFEEKAFNYISHQLETIPNENKQNITFKYVLRNIKDLLLRDEIGKTIKGQDFIYSIGIFDYLPERIAMRLFTILYGLLNDNGKLMICNASQKNSSHRAYYEILGDWNMIYRNEEDILRWANNINGYAQRYFESPDNMNRYLYFFIAK